MTTPVPGKTYTLDRPGNVHHGHDVRVTGTPDTYTASVHVHCTHGSCMAHTFAVSPSDLVPVPDEVEPPPPPPGVSTEHPPRYLFVAIPLTDDPAEDPTDATELIDLIAERHESIRFEAHELTTDPPETT